MAVDKNVNVTFTGKDNVSPIVKKMNKLLGEQTVNNLKSVGAAFIAVNQAAELTGKVFGKLVGSVGAAIAAANKQEDAVNKLNSSLMQMGEFTPQLSAELRLFASQLQETTRYGDESTISMLSFAQAMGASVDQSKTIVTAAADISAALGIEFNSAVKNLTVTLGGLSGELGEKIPELKALTKEELQAGKGVEILSAKFRGFAERDAKTFSGAVSQASNAFGDLLEEVGFLITKNELVISSVRQSIIVFKSLAQQAQGLNEFINQNSENIKALAYTIGTLTAGVTAYITISKAREMIEKALYVSTNNLFSATRKNKIETIAATSSQKAQIIVDKASLAIKKILTTSIIKDTIATKANMVIQKAQQAILKGQVVVQKALATAKALLTANTIRNSAVEKANAAIQAASALKTKALAAITGAIAAARNLFTVATLKNTAVTIANTAAQIAANVAQKALAVGIGVVTAAQWAFNAALTANPIGLIIVGVAALGAGLFALFKNIDLVAGAIKVGLGTAIQYASELLILYAKGVSLVVGLFNKDWANSINSAAQSVQDFGTKMAESGRIQMAAARAAKENAKSNSEVANAAEIAKQKVLEQEQALVKLNVQYGKAVGKAKAAFDAAAEFSPELKLDKFMKEQESFEKALLDLKKKGEDLKVRLTAEGDSAEIKSQIDSITQQQSQAEEALRALKIRKQQEVRAARIQEVQLELEQKKQKIFTVEQEIKQMRLDSAREARDQLIQIETNRLLQQRGLLSADAQEGISAKQQAALNANEIELQAFRNKLDAERQLALSAEQQKQLELAGLRASLLQGTSGGAAAEEDVAVAREKQKLAELQVLRQQELISEQKFQMDRNAIIAAGKQRQFEFEVQKEQERIAALGMSPEALSARLELQRKQDEMEMQNLRMKLQNKQLTEQEFRIASEQLEMNSADRAAQTRENFLKQEIEQNRRRGNSWKATLKEVELAQQQHGKVMGTLRAVQGSAEFGAIQGMLGNLSQLRNSESKKEFEIGKKAAIAQTMINTFMSATAAFSALAGIPIVGPALGAAAAAAAVAAGMMNVRQIKNQKFGGGANSGSLDAPTAQVPTETLGGQAHQGMDAVPQSMNNKSFLLKAGERVVQPEANRDLTGFLDRVNNGDQNLGGNTINITVQGNISSQADARIIADAVVQELRAKSERGEPVINSKGIVNG